MRHYTKLDKIYNQESNADIKERIQLVRRITQDKQHIEDVAKELHRCRAWAYKCKYKRYNEKWIRRIERPTKNRYFQMYQKKQC
ncbi:MAG: hypothetical protein MRJ93_00285 [Nitrososphaeraceae archaeon]|nr:hypothetical protein [Nitrososphaeraceae archaeon]